MPRTKNRKHEWQRSRFAGTVTCARCRLLPLDDDDFESDCEPEGID
jgi:hypothetical protein